MGKRYEGDNATANGFRSRTLHEKEANTLYEARYMAPPDMRALGEWRLSAGGILMSPEPRENASASVMHWYFYGALMLEQHADPHRDLENVVTWNAFFWQ
jgi:hypothetical protein